MPTRYIEYDGSSFAVVSVKHLIPVFEGVVGDCYYHRMLDGCGPKAQSLLKRHRNLIVHTRTANSQREEYFLVRRDGTSYMPIYDTGRGTTQHKYTVEVFEGSRITDAVVLIRKLQALIAD